MIRNASVIAGLMLALVSAHAQGQGRTDKSIAPDRPIVIRGASILTITHGTIKNGTVLLDKGKIQAVGVDIPIPANAEIIDAEGKYVSPGLINPHSHTGIYPLLGMQGNLDLSEAQGNIHSGIRSLDAVDTDDPEIARAVSGGVTTLQLLPGSDNNIGGWTTVIKLNGATRIEDALFPGAPPGMKWAWGENPKTEHTDRGDHPATLMGEAAMLRQRLLDAQHYTAKWKEWEDNGKKGTPPERDLQLEGLAQVLAGKVRVHVHAYQTNHFEDLFRLSDEFHFPIASIHHALDAYMIAPELARRHIGVVTFGDYWGYKVEAWNGIPQNAYLLWKNGVVVSMHTDSPVMEDRDYRLQAAIALHYGLPEDVAMQTLTINPAKILGIDTRVGSIEPGKDADLVIWSGDPLEITSKAERVYIDGKLVYTLRDGFLPWKGRSGISLQ
jgi:imidazolonepropionase-like amidohydrolase